MENSSKLKLILGRVILLKKFKITDELAEKLHKPLSRKFDRRMVSVNSIDKIWADDLFDMQSFSKQNKGINTCLP